MRTRDAVIAAALAGEISPAQAAEELGVPRATLRTWLFRARHGTGRANVRPTTDRRDNATATERNGAKQGSAAPGEGTPPLVRASAGARMTRLPGTPEEARQARSMFDEIVPFRPASTARPTLLTAELAEAICQRIREGTPPRSAAALEGVHPRTWGDWLERGREDPDTPHGALVREVTAADAEAEHKFATAPLLGASVLGNIDASKFVAERRFPSHYGKPEGGVKLAVGARVARGGAVPSASEVVDAGLSEEELFQIAITLVQGRIDGE